MAPRCGRPRVVARTASVTACVRTSARRTTDSRDALALIICPPRDGTTRRTFLQRGARFEKCSRGRIPGMPARPIWRSALDQIAPYDVGKPLETLTAELGLRELVRLSANENPLGPSATVVAAIQAEADRVHLYPDGA